MTGDAGDWALLSQEEFTHFVEGRIEPGHPRYEDLHRKGFLRREIDLDALAARLRQKKLYLGRGPHLHVIVTTLRCQQSCRYCHASRRGMERTDTDMSIETARKVVDFAMKSRSPFLNFEFQGGEPTVNAPVVRFVVEYAKERNRQENKALSFSLVTNFQAMTEELGEWLLANDVYLCTSLDGPRDLHDANRPSGAGGSFDQVMHWLHWFNQRYVEMGRDPELWHVDALLTTTRATLRRWEEVIDLYVGLKIRNLHLRPLNPYGFAAKSWRQIGYSTEEFLDFYASALESILERNRAGVEVMEGTAAILLSKMLTPDDPGHVDILSPCGAGTGQVAYSHEGRIYTCDEGRMLAAAGDEMFAIGDVSSAVLAETLRHPTVRALALASLTDSLPSCSTCWNNPFCGVCPIHNYTTQGDLMGQRPRSSLCKLHYTLSTLLFEHLARDSSGEVEAIFRRWVTNRPRQPAPACST